MSITVNTRVYTADRVQPDAVAYVSPVHTLSSTDKMELGRVYPKPQGSFKGVAKPNVKFTKTVTVNAITGETAPLIAAVSFSVPVGTPDAACDTICADLASFFALPEAKALLKSLDING